MTDEKIEIVDVDKSWDGKGSLDEHRQREFKKIKHPGFGKASAQPAAAPAPPVDITEDEDEAAEADVE